MSTMRSGREIRQIVQNARQQSVNPYEDEVSPPEDLSKKLFAQSQELDELKQKFGALKRNYDSVSHHSAKDSVENVRLQKMRDEYENQIKALQQSLSKAQDELVVIKSKYEDVSIRVKEQSIEIEGKTKEIEQLKKELARQQKMADSRIENFNVSNKQLLQENQKLKNDFVILQKQLDIKLQTIDSLQQQLALAHDAVNAIKELQHEVNVRIETITQLELQLSQVKALLGQEQTLLQVKSKEYQVLEAKLSQALSNEKNQAQNVVRLEAEKKDLNQKNVALAEQLAILRGQGDTSSQDINALKAKYAQVVRESQDYKLKSELLLESEKTVAAGLRKEIESKQQQYKADLQKLQVQCNLLSEAKDTACREAIQFKSSLQEFKTNYDELSKQSKQMFDKIKELECAIIKREQDHQGCGARELALKDQERLVTVKLDQAVKALESEKQANEKLTQFKSQFTGFVDKVKAGQLSVEQALSCLSCLEFLKEPPLTLVCGHSICNHCFTKHSDPKSKDSLVFCEECKIETKNKQLKDSKFVNTLAAKVLVLKIAVDSMIKAAK